MWFQLTRKAWCACVLLLCVWEYFSMFISNFSILCYLIFSISMFISNFPIPIFPHKNQPVAVQSGAFGMLGVCPPYPWDPAWNEWLKWCFVPFQTQFLRFPWRSSFSLCELDCRDKPLSLSSSISCSSPCNSNFFSPSCAGWNHLQVETWDPWGWKCRNVASISLSPYIFECISVNKNLAHAVCKHGERWALKHLWYSKS